MSKKNNKDFNIIVDDILNNEEFKKLDDELHHGISRYNHALRVAKTTYHISKALHLKNAEATTRAALLHDFYTDNQFNDERPREKLVLHPVLAVENAKKHYDINDLQENIITSHMFPLKGAIPKYKESWLVSGVDKSVALYEMYRYKVSLMVNIWVLFLFNLLIIQK